VLKSTDRARSTIQASTCCQLPSPKIKILILLEQITLLATHIKHCRSTVLHYGRGIELIKRKKLTDFFTISLHFLFSVASFSFFSCNHFYANGLHLSRAQPCSSISNLSNSPILLHVQSFTDKNSLQRKTARYCRTPMKSGILMPALSSLTNNIILLLLY